MILLTRDVFLEWLKAEFADQIESGFPLLTGLPNTQVVRFLDQFATLGREARDELVSVLCEWSSHNLTSEPPNPIYERYVQVTAFPEQRGGYRYTGVPLIAALVKEQGSAALADFLRAQCCSELAMQPSPNLVADDADLTPIGIPKLRRLVKKVFTDRFSAVVTDLGSEILRYDGEADGTRLRIEIRYSGRITRPQLDYRVEIRRGDFVVAPPKLSVESIFGLGAGGWNYLTIGNAERNVALLGERIVWLAQLPGRLGRLGG